NGCTKACSSVSHGSATGPVLGPAPYLVPAGEDFLLPSEAALRSCQVGRQLCPLPRVEGVPVRQCGLELAQRVFVGGGLERTLTRECEVLNNSGGISQCAGFGEVVRDLAGALVHSAGMDPLDRLRYL